MRIDKIVYLFILVVPVLFFAPCIVEAGLPGPRNVRYVTQPQLKVGPEVSLLKNDSLEGWTTTSGKTPGKAWKVENGVLHLDGKGGDIMTDKEYENYILDFVWTISKGGNSGIKYRFQKFEGKGWLGCEYQVLDDFNTPEGKKPRNNTATLYDILPLPVPKHLNPNTEKNYGRVIVNGNHIQHWLNGQKVLDVMTGTEAWKKAIAESKFKDANGFGENPLGRIMVQDHGCEVWFHKISIRELRHEETLLAVSQPGAPSVIQPYQQVAQPITQVVPQRCVFSNPMPCQKIVQKPVCYSKGCRYTTCLTPKCCKEKWSPRHRCLLRKAFIFNRFR